MEYSKEEEMVTPRRKQDGGIFADFEEGMPEEEIIEEDPLDPSTAMKQYRGFFDGEPAPEAFDPTKGSVWADKSASLDDSFNEEPQELEAPETSLQDAPEGPEMLKQALQQRLLDEQIQRKERAQQFLEKSKTLVRNLF